MAKVNFKCMLAKAGMLGQVDGEVSEVVVEVTGVAEVAVAEVTSSPR